MGTPERPNGWVRTKLHGTLKLLRGPPECQSDCPNGWVSTKPPGILTTLTGTPR